jgi:membrane protein
MSIHVGELLRKTLTGWWNDRAMSMGAAITFYAIFSMAPMLLVVIAVAGLAFGRDAATAAIVHQISILVGEKAASTVEALLVSAGNIGSGVVGTVIGIGTFLVFVTGAFVELQDDLNIIWKAKRPAYSGVLVFLFNRLAGLVLIVAIGFLLFVSLTVDATLAAASRYLAFYGLDTTLVVLNSCLALAASVLLFALIFKVLPSTIVAWRDAWVGGAATGILFAVGKFLIGFYLGKSHLGSSYGAAASLISILLWLYYSSQILLLGAEFTRTYAELRRGDPLVE